jgi:hypothetical protein
MRRRREGLNNWTSSRKPRPGRAGLFTQNIDAIEAHRKLEAEFIYRFRFIDQRMGEFASRPNWIAVINIRSLAKAAAVIQKKFLAMDTQKIDTFLRVPKKPLHRRRPK